jgi:hypothetical protein
MSTRRLLSMLLVSFLAIGVRGAAAQAPAEASPVVVLRLANNTLLVGQIVREEGDSVVFNAGALGELTIKRADIVAQLDPNVVSQAFQAPQAAAPPPASGLAGFAGQGKVVWTKVAMFGGSYTSAPFKQGEIDPSIPGLTGSALRLQGQQTTAQGQVTVLRASNLGIFFVDGSIVYAFSEPFGKQANVPKISTGYNFRLKSGQRLYGVTRYTWYKDDIRQVKYSNQLLFGLGIHTIDTPKVKLDLVPGIGAVKEKKGTVYDNEWLGAFGALSQLTISPNQFAQIEQRETFYQVFEDSSYRGLESYLGFKGMLSRQLGVQFGLSHIYDNAIAQRAIPIPANAFFPGQPAFSLFANKKTQVLFTAGFLVRF